MREETMEDRQTTASLIDEGQYLVGLTERTEDQAVRFADIERELKDRLRCTTCHVAGDHLNCTKRVPDARGRGGCCCLRSWADLAGVEGGHSDGVG